MGVLRDPGKGKDGALRIPAAGAVSVRCSRCRSNIAVSSVSASSPVRCGRCGYPMVLRSDLLALVEACAGAKSSQAGTALSILQFLADDLPEAGAALGVLTSRYTLPLSERVRWSRLMAAYAAGDRSAQQGLDLMCKSTPDVFTRRTCPECGAPAYTDRLHQGKTLCVYCHSAD